MRSWALCPWALGWRGVAVPRPGLRVSRELAGVGGLGKVNRELGMEEILLFRPMALCHLPAPWPQHEGQQKGCSAGPTSERVPKVPPPLEFWVRIGPSRLFFKSCTPSFFRIDLIN